MTQFQQGTTTRIQILFLTQQGTLAAQPEGHPTIEISYIDTFGDLNLHTAVPSTIMNTIEPGRYFFDWEIPFSQPTTDHQIIYRGLIDGLSVIGEDVATVLPANSAINSSIQCVFEPTTIQGGRQCQS